MKIFNVYSHPTRGVEAVKVGFSWPAFFFGLLWMVVKKLWGLSILWFGLYLLLSIIGDAAEKSHKAGVQALTYLVITAAYLALLLIPAFEGNRWREDNLSKRGYKLLGKVDAENPDAAVAVWRSTHNG